MLKEYPVLGVMHRRAGLNFTAGNVASVLLIVGPLLVLLFTAPSLLAPPPYPGYTKPPSWILLILLAPILLGGLNIYMGLNNAKRELPYMIRRLGDFHGVAREIENDFAGHTLTRSPIQIGQHWFCYVRGERSFTAPLDQFVWAYLSNDERSPVIPKPQLTFRLRSGDKVDLPMPATAATAALHDLAAKAPWMALGHSEALQQSWNNDQRDVLALIDQARNTGVSFASLAGPKMSPPVSAAEQPSDARVMMWIIAVAAGVIMNIVMMNRR